MLAETVLRLIGAVAAILTMSGACMLAGIPAVVLAIGLLILYLLSYALVIEAVKQVRDEVAAVKGELSKIRFKSPKDDDDDNDDG
jgi:H+/gluconate symporter-like permease